MTPREPGFNFAPLQRGAAPSTPQVKTAAKAQAKAAARGAAMAVTPQVGGKAGAASLGGAVKVSSIVKKPMSWIATENPQGVTPR